MNIIIKTPEEIEILREGGRRLAEVMRKVAARVAPGVTPEELDEYAEELIRANGDEPAFKGYAPEGTATPYPGTLCTSVNEEVVHGIPGGRVLEGGDIISIDCGVKHKGMFTDHAVTLPVGTVTPEMTKLMNMTREAMRIGIAAAKPGNTTGDIGAAIEKFVDGRYGIVRVLSGHGVGKYIHEDPYVPNYGKPGTGVELVPGMVIAIEPMLNIGTHDVLLLEDDYTFITSDKQPSAHFEHTVYIGEHGPEILTQ